MPVKALAASACGSASPPCSHGKREAPGVEPGEQPHQQLVAGHAPFGDQFAVLIDLLDAAVDRAVEGDRREPPGGELLRRVPRRGERRRADAQRLCGATVKRAAAAARWTEPVSARGQEKRWRSTLHPARRLREDSRGTPSKGIGGWGLARLRRRQSAPPPACGWSPSPRGGGREQIGRPGLVLLGQRDQRQARTADLVRGVRYIRELLAGVDQSSNSSTVMSLCTRLAMNLFLTM